ncbi:MULTISPECIES: dihydrofolate reductase [Clostridium]|jgi:dihydrofolate reductase (EC 1.5.1.3)|uniref:Dihydrofolate reductase n=2 Tax=Clostridium beijerinckii TaxID=1520 RepID=A0AAE2RRM3_CLOBE|nr:MULTISPECIES: dihydrofolate reductase [Clostridium]ABR37059.1 Dihydrofolate reductase [Clostridium beijerinckii NCIMB 8052]AIU02137.1 dihydrofolate reductase [Clostridium beijerinckii ATCC 35702]MBF7808293.1 dihydrofolate reductase [Clostridium beijerinckii]NOW93282.1 dihydrofolate reductase [Clostridium beijerinckii]NRT21861.1 dihydrofolate reductase [Clostridium beijerinckii]
MISIIVAIAKDNVIGKDNKLLWHISEDLKRFKKITTGKKMIMGRKTFESLPGILPNREHIVLTRDNNFNVDSDKVTIEHDFNSVLQRYSECEDEVFVIGGAEIYKQFLPYAKKLYLTKVDEEFEGDTYFPGINYSNYNTEYTSEKFIDEKNGLHYTFVNLIQA